LVVSTSILNSNQEKLITYICDEKNQVNMSHVKKVVLYSTLIFSSYFSFAQDKNVDLDPVTITSSLTSVTASKTGRNIIVIKGEDFSKLPINSIDELLRYVPGIEIQARAPMGGQSDIVLRGGTFQQVLVIVDGIRINDPLTGHFNSYIPIAPSEIERIEVLKGASSAVYGSDAVGGVINIVTKAFAAGTKQRKEISAQLTAGEYNLKNANAGGFYSNGKTSVAAGFLSNNSDGQLQRGTRGFFNLNTASVSLNHKINDAWQIGFRSAFDDRKFSAQNFYTTFASDTADEKVQTFWNQLRLTYARSSNKFSVNFGYKALDDKYKFNTASIPNHNKAKIFQALSTYEHQFSDNANLISGVQFFDRSIKSNDRGDHHVKQLGAFAIWQQYIGALTLSPALRFDWDERGGTELIPQLNASYRLGKVLFRGSAGKTIRHADFTERYNNYNKTLVTSGRIGNPDLKAERSFSYEIGSDVYLANNLKIAATYFQRDHDDLIDYVTTSYTDMPRKTNLSPAGTYALAKNISEVNTKGFETDVQYIKDLNSKNRIHAMLGFTWLESQSSEVTPSFYISSHARLLTNFSVLYSNPRFSISFNGLYKSRQKQVSAPIKAEITKDYFLLNAKAEGFLIRQKLSLFAQVDNVFDRNYSDLLGTPMPGRWLMGGLKLSLSR
jgi:vitamin B12 transporter